MQNGVCMTATKKYMAVFLSRDRVRLTRRLQKLVAEVTQEGVFVFDLNLVSQQNLVCFFLIGNNQIRETGAQLVAYQPLCDLDLLNTRYTR